MASILLSIIAFVLVLVSLSNGVHGFVQQPLSTSGGIECLSRKQRLRYRAFGNRSNRLHRTDVELCGDAHFEPQLYPIQIIDHSLVLSADTSLLSGLSSLLTLGFAVAVGAFVYANVVYTPEIVQGAQSMRQTNREVEIRKLLQALGNHLENGNDLEDLRVPLETALGTSLEDYTMEVDSTKENDTTTFFTLADRDLVKLVKENI